MCSIITIKQGSLKLERLEKYLSKESFSNDDGMSLLVQDKKGKMTALRTFNLDLIMAVLKGMEWSRMWMHMRAATQGEVNIRNTHGWMTTDGTAIMHNGILWDKDAYKFNVDSELIVDWVEQLGIDFALEMLKEESYANVFLIKNLGDYYVSRTKSGTLFTDGNGNFSTNQVGQINKPVKPGFQKMFESGFKPESKSVRAILDYEDDAYSRSIYGYESFYGYKPRYYSSNGQIIDTQTGLPLTAGFKYPAGNTESNTDDSGRFNDDGSMNGKSARNEETVLLEEDEAYERAKEEIAAAWDQVLDRDSVSDEDYRTYLDEGRLIEFERYKRTRKVS